MSTGTLFVKNKKCPADCTACVEACAARDGGGKLPVIEKVSLPEKNYETVMTCNQCSSGDCVEVCPTGALYHDGDVVKLNESICIGCGLCNMSCPFGGIFSYSGEHKSSKCDMCAHAGTPACVEACPHAVLQQADSAEVTGNFGEDPFSPGLQFCAGCTMELVVRTVLKTVGKDVVLFGAPSCCVLSDKVRVPYYGTLMTNVASSASGVSRYFKKTGRKTLCLAIIGDGATADLGFGQLSAAAERGERMLYICYDNEAYMNTGIQRSGTTPFGSWTNTTQIGTRDRGKSRDAKNVPLLISQHNVEYAATATLSHMSDFVEKIKKGKEAAQRGFAYIHVFAPCPTGWKMSTSKAIEVTDAAVETNYFPLWECENGNYRFTYTPVEKQPIGEYTEYMKRFAHLNEDETAILQGFVDNEYQRIERMTKFDLT